MSWAEKRLGDVITLKRGYDLTESQRQDGDIPVVSSSGITGTHNVAMVKGPGVVTGRYGTMGEVFYVESDFWPHNTSLYVRDFKGNDERFVSYFLKLVLRGAGSDKAAVPGVNRNELHERNVCVPDVDTQRRIVEQLKPIDDLIENNRRRISLLEHSAQLLYREWFVYLRFPGHEHVKTMDGVPEGWEKLPLSSFCVVGRGGSPRPIDKFMGGSVPWFKIGDATASESSFVFNTKELLQEEGIKKSVFLAPKELILSNSATCGVPYFTGVAGCIHDGWLYFKNLQRISKWFLYCGLHAKQYEILMGIGEGATQKNLNTDYVAAQKFFVPKESLFLREFDEQVEPLFKQIFLLAQYNKKLREARDLLLPRLISGELKV